MSRWTRREWQSDFWVAVLIVLIVGLIIYARYFAK